MFTIPVTCHCSSCDATEVVQAEVTPERTANQDAEEVFYLVVKDPDQLKPTEWVRDNDSASLYKCKSCSIKETVTVEIGVQVNRRTRASMDVSRFETIENAIASARAIDVVKRSLEGMDIIRVDYARGRNINFMVRPE